MAKWTAEQKLAASERYRLARLAKAEAAAAGPEDDAETGPPPEAMDDPQFAEDPDFDGVDEGQIDGPADLDARRARLLEGIDPAIAGLISDAELDKIEAEEQQKAEAERKKQALATVRDQMRQRARVDHDLIHADVLRSDAEKKRLAERVKFKVTLPSEGAGHSGRNGFRVDGRLFQAGFTYTEPRAVFESLQANHYRAWLSEVAFKTLDQHKPGQSAREILGQTIPQFEVMA